MKTLILLMTIIFTFNTFATKGGGGGNFEYMRSLDSLKEKDIDKILEDNGGNYLSSVITPSLLNLIFHASLPERIKLINYEIKENQYPPMAGLKSLVSSMVGNDSIDEIENKIKYLKVKSCTCRDIKEDGYDINHFCYKNVNAQDFICIDKESIFNTKNPVSINFHELTAMFWHEITHMMNVGEKEHGNNMPIYRTILELSQKDELFKYEVAKNSKRVKIRKNKNKEKVSKCTLRISNNFYRYTNSFYHITDKGFYSWPESVVLYAFDLKSDLVQIKKKAKFSFATLPEKLFIKTNNMSLCYQMGHLYHSQFGRIFQQDSFENDSIKVKF